MVRDPWSLASSWQMFINQIPARKTSIFCLFEAKDTRNNLLTETLPYKQQIDDLVANTHCLSIVEKFISFFIIDMFLLSFVHYTSIGIEQSVYFCLVSMSSFCYCRHCGTVNKRIVLHLQQGLALLVKTVRSHMSQIVKPQFLLFPKQDLIVLQTPKIVKPLVFIN